MAHVSATGSTVLSGEPSHDHHSSNIDDTNPRGSGRGRRGGRGRGNRGRGRGRGRGRDFAQNAPFPDSEADPEDTSGRPPGGFGARLTGAATQSRDETGAEERTVQDTEAETDDGEVCFICASPIEHVSIAPCNHQTCHICSLRLRALYKTRACAHCRTEAPYVVFTDDADRRFQDFQDSDFVKIDDNLGIKYEKDVILEDTILLLRYNCPEKTCDVACLGWPDLHRHVKNKHGKIMCDLCTRNKKVFTHEHELFSFGELRRHEKHGDDKPGAEDQSGFKGHPECGFCRERFYGDDELYSHCRERHERCHICDRRNATNGRSPQYYLNYEELEKHFADKHFVCLDAECQANKTNVFESEMDLQAHQIAAHPNGITKGREGRLLNLSGFDLRQPYQPSRRGGREREREQRGNGRGRDPNADPLPVSTAQSLSRAEMAFQRQVAIQNAQSGPGRTFGGSLTQSTPAQAHRSQPAPRSQQDNVVPAMTDLTLSASQSANTANMTPQEQARQLRHQAVTSRATTLLKNDQTKLSQFRTHLSAYRSGTTNATDLIDSFFSLFDCPSVELGKLVRELADLYEEETKRRNLLEAWNSWRSINEDYPSLPGPSGTLPGTSGGINLSSGRRVLKLKSSTAQSSRSAATRQDSWGSAFTSGSRDPFPALSRPTAQSSTINALPWGPPPSNPNAKSSKIITAPSHTRPQPPPSIAAQTTASRIANSTRPPSTMTRSQNEEMFPSLPAAAKPNVMMAGFNTKGAMKWGANSTGSGSASPAPWLATSQTPRSGGSAFATGVNANALDDALLLASDSATASAAQQNKKKGKGKGKKEVLYHFG